MQEQQLQPGGSKSSKGQQDGEQNGNAGSSRDTGAGPKDTDKAGEAAAGSNGAATSPYGAISASLNWDMFYIVLNLWKSEVGIRIWTLWMIKQSGSA